MPGDGPRHIYTQRSASSQRRPEAAAGPAHPEAILAVFESDLEKARAEYATGRDAAILPVLRELDNRLLVAHVAARGESESGFALAEASLNTLLGRALSRSDYAASRSAFQRAAELFARWKVAAETHPSKARLLTDWGIALHRLSKIEDSVKLLSRVCEGGTAPVEAFAYLGYGCHESKGIFADRRSGLSADRSRPCALNRFGLVHHGSRLFRPDVGERTRRCHLGISCL